MGIFVATSSGKVVDVVGVHTQVSLTSTAGNKDLGSITYPALTGVIVAAFLDLDVSNTKNNDGSISYTTPAQQLQISPNAGVNWYNACTIQDASFGTPGSGYGTHSYRHYGTTDLKTYITGTPGGSIMVRWYQAQTNRVGALEINNATPILRLLMV
jgi:hypothetical protein